jgi:diguanylate cyclase (GGDEF)-like protein/PAS domain S-box-containing protein
VVSLVAAVFGAAGSLAWMRFRLGGPAIAEDYDVVAEGVVAWLAAGTCLWGSFRGDGRMRRFWMLVSASCFVWGLGEGVWAYYTVGLGAQVPSPSLADVGFLSAVPLMVAALLAFPLAPARSLARVMLLLDGALVAAATLFVSWALVLGPVYRAHQGGVLAQTVTLAYPAADVLIVVVALFVASRASRSARIPLLLVGGGVLALAFSDSAFAYLTESGRYGSGLNVDIGWIVGFLLLGLAPIWSSDAVAWKASAERPTVLGVLMPYVPVAGALVLAIVYSVSARRLGTFLVVDGVVLALVLSCRQLLALLHSVSAGNQQVALFAALERHSSDLTTIVSADGTILYQSVSSGTLLGHPPEQLEGRAFEEILHPDDAPGFLHALAQVTSAAGNETTSDWRLRHRDGHYVDAESRAVNLLADANVRGVTINSRNISERKQLEEELRNQAVRDPLTGLANRTLLNDRLAHALELRKTDNRDLAVLFVDLDDLKNVNDGLGHTVGDELLQEVGRRLQSVVRATDTVARVSGDEFAIVLDDVLSPSDTEGMADRVLDSFRHPFLLAGQERRSHASLGIAVADSETADAASLLHEADIAMYAAKASGKNRRATYRRGMHEHALDQLQLTADMRLAVGNDELVVVYQPIIDLATKRITSVEALMRWQHPTRGLLVPDAFIPAAETSGLIIPMGRWLLRRACREVRTWPELEAGPPLKLNVNLSARQLDDPDLITDVAGALAESRLEPSRLTFEITETALLHDLDSAMAVLNALRALGVELAIDDFGTGYSSLSYLRQLPVNEIKIDRSFISAMTESEESAKLVRTIMQLADDFHLRTVAEGVETSVQLERLRAADCGLAQGYLFARPLSEAELQDALRNESFDWAARARDAGHQTEDRRRPRTRSSPRPDRKATRPPG